MADIIVLIIILAVVAAAVCYIVREKKKGKACIGCPNAGSCGGACAATKRDKKSGGGIDA